MNQCINVVAVSDQEPWYKRKEGCNTKNITLTISTPEDDLIFKTKGVVALRKHKLQRFHRECEEQKALLSYEQLAKLIGVSSKTIARYIQSLKGAGIMIKTRGSCICDEQ